MSNIQPGDHVSWTHVSSGRKTLSMSLREGVVESIGGDFAVIKKKRGRETIALKRLRTKGQQSQIAEFVEAIRERRSDQ
jgi:hypothetical protein